MSDRPIIFSAPMVRALLDGRKTQTRRLATSPLRHCKPGDRLWVRENAAVRYTSEHYIDGHSYGITYAADENEYGQYIATNACGGGIRKGKPPSVFPNTTFRKDGTLRWQPSIHMPRWASRLTLTVTNVRVQRLQDICEEDAEHEGAARLAMDEDGKFYEVAAGSYRCGFAGLWDHLHGASAWDSNPHLVALTFTVGRGNIDALAAAGSTTEDPPHA